MSGSIVPAPCGDLTRFYIPLFFHAFRSESIGRKRIAPQKTSTSERLYICHQRLCRYKVARLRHA